MFWMLSPLWLMNTNVLTIFVASHSLISKVSSEWKVNPGFVTQKKCPFPLNRHVPTPGGLLGISSDGDDQMAPKVKTQKNP